MNKHERKFNSNDYQPKRFGLKYNRPGIILEYLVPSTGKLYHHKIRLYHLKSDSNMQDVMKEIYEKHYQYLDNKKVSPNQILKLVERLKMNIKQNEQNNTNPNNFKSNLNSYLNNIHTGKKENENTKNNLNNLANESKNNNEDKNNKIEINELEDDEENEDYYKFYDYDNEDLNKLDDDELKTRKNEMEVLYKKNAVLPNDEKFVFDVRVRSFIPY